MVTAFAVNIGETVINCIVGVIMSAEALKELGEEAEEIEDVQW